ncbi:MAG: hypothetical protein LBT58_05490 [Endomicrobium sp.]|nr:hypothetical protein [Endomicrobium sp.]
MSTSLFYGKDVHFKEGVFINMRTQSSNELRFYNLTSSASICYDINLENKFVDRIVVDNRKWTAARSKLCFQTFMRKRNIQYNFGNKRLW